MARGFKDETGKFHPTERRIAHSSANPRLHDNSLQVGIQGSQITSFLKKQAKDFAKKKTLQAIERIEGAKDRQARELEIRRDFEKRLISSFKRARKLQIKNPVLLKNQIFIDVPELKDSPENIKFVEKILNDFIKREKTKDKAINNAKSDEQKIAIEDAFSSAEKLEEDDVKKQLARGETRLKKKQQDELDRLKAKEKRKQKTEEEIGEKAVKDFQDKEAKLSKAEEEKEKILKEEQKKADEIAKQKKEEEVKKAKEKEPVVTFADLETQEEANQKAEKEKDESMEEFLEIQKETLDAQEDVEDLTEDAEKAREVAEFRTSINDDEDEVSTDGFPKEIVV